MSDLLQKLDKALKSLRDPIFRHALRHGVAPSHEHRAMLESFGNIQTVVDVGANVGQFALMAVRCLPGVRVHSFEPLPDAAEKFKVIMAGYPHVHLHRNALGASEATLPIHVTARADSSSLLAPTMQTEIYPGTHEIGVQQVKVLPLDKCLAAEDLIGPALLKIDVQGYEQQVLEGCETLLPLFDWVFAELSFAELYAGQTLAPTVVLWLEQRGFRLDGVYVSPMSYKGGRMIQGDFLFRRLHTQEA